MIKELWRRKLKRAGRWLLSLLLTFSLMWVYASMSWSAEETYPNKPIQIIVPMSPGGGIDLASKVVANRISEFLGQPLISMYKPGGGGSLGSSFVAKAKPDGYTVLVGGSSAHILPLIVKNVDYKLDDFIPVGMYGRMTNMLCVKADARWKTLKEFIAEEKIFPGKLMVGSYGKLTLSDFIIMCLNKFEGINLKHVPFTSSGPAITAALGGHVDLAISGGAGGLWESGLIRILATSSEKRYEDMPEVPTLKELGYPIVMTLLHSFYFPKNTPKWIVDKFAKAQEKAFERYSKEIKEELRRVEMWAEFHNQEETMELYKKEYDLYLKLSREFNIVSK